MIRTSPFHERTSALNQTHLWSHWSNVLAAARYQCGSGTHPGGCVIGAPSKLAAGQILKDRAAGRA